MARAGKHCGSSWKHKSNWLAFVCLFIYLFLHLLAVGEKGWVHSCFKNPSISKLKSPPIPNLEIQPIPGLEVTSVTGLTPSLGLGISPTPTLESSPWKSLSSKNPIESLPWIQIFAASCPSRRSHPVGTLADWSLTNMALAGLALLLVLFLTTKVLFVPTFPLRLTTKFQLSKYWSQTIKSSLWVSLINRFNHY